MRQIAVITLVAVTTAVAIAAPARVAPAALPFDMLWQRDVPGRAPIAAATSDTSWLAVGFSDRVDFLSLTSGATVWSLPLPAQRLACDASVCLAGDNSAIRAIDLAKRTVRWQQATPAPLAFAPTLRSGWVFLTATDGRIFALRDTDGKRVWTFEPGLALTAPPSIDGERIAVATMAPDIRLLDLRTGRALWTTPLDDAPGAPRLGGSRVYVGTEGGVLVAIDAASGGVKFTQSRSGLLVGAPSLDEHLVYTGGLDGVLRAFDRSNGTQRWNTNLPTRPATGPLVDQDLVVVALRTGAFQAFLTKAGHVAALLPGSAIGDSTVRALPPLVAGSGASLRLVTLTYDIGDLTQWTATVTRAAAGLKVSGLPATIPGLALTLTAPR